MDIAEWHASAFKDNKNSDVVAACDVNNDRLNEFCQINLILIIDIIVSMNF